MSRMASFATQVEAAPEHHQKHREPGNEGKPHVHTAQNLTFPKLIQSTVVSVSIIMYDETSQWGHHFSRVFGIREKLALFYRSYGIVASRDKERENEKKENKMLENERDILIERVRAWFDAPEQVQHYHREASEGPAEAEAWLLQILPEQGRVLDLGCGAGRITRVLARRGLQAVGVDVSPNLIEQACSLTVDIEPKPQLLCVEALTLPFPDASFDAAVAFKLYGYIPSREQRLAYLAEISRVLKPSAPLLFPYYVVPPNAFSLYTDEQQAASQFRSLEPGDMFCNGAGFVHWFTADQLRDELSCACLQLEAFRSDAEWGGSGLIRLAVLRRPRSL